MKLYSFLIERRASLGVSEISPTGALISENSIPFIGRYLLTIRIQEHLS